jgi:uncharacterized lipoprotein YajG
MRVVRGVGGLLASLTIMILSAGCVFTPHEVQIAPTTQAVSSEIGRGTRVFFRFIDDRDDVTVGNRGISGNGAKINAADLPRTVEAELRKGLQQKQFELVPVETSADAAVTYRMRSFKFAIERGFFTGGQNAAAALAVDARHKDRSFANVYRYNDEQRIVVAPGGDEINRQMNAVLSDLLQQANADKELDRFLATP